MPYIKTNDGCRIYYEMQGLESSRPVIVFLNGTMQSTSYWKTHSEVLKNQFPVLIYDARAQGKSDLGQKKLSLEIHTSDLSTLLSRLGIEKAHLVGLSHGAIVAISYAAASPEQVDKLVLCSVSEKPNPRTRLIVRSWLEILKNSDLETLAWSSIPFSFGENFLRQKEKTLRNIVKAIAKRNKKESLVAQLNALAAYPPLYDIARKVLAPSLFISGSEDPFVTVKETRQLAKLCGGTCKQIKGSGHSIPAEAPELFIKTLMDFICET
jgi:3-oxoadipate enol-lactonase